MMYTQVQDAATMLEDEVIASIVIASSLINNGERTSIKAKEKLNDPETTRKKLEVSALSTRDESFDLSLGEKEMLKDRSPKAVLSSECKLVSVVTEVRLVPAESNINCNTEDDSINTPSTSTKIGQTSADYHDSVITSDSVPNTTKSKDQTVCHISIQMMEHIQNMVLSTIPSTRDKPLDLSFG